MSELKSTALVTGGTRGIGRAVATTLAGQGFQVYLTYVSKPEEAAKVCEEIADQGGSAKAFCLNVADSGAVAGFFKEEIKNKVSLDVLVNNAGITKDGLLIRMKDQDFEKVLSVNLTGTFTCVREAAKIMVRQKKGRIVNISSVVGLMGNAGQCNYAASKAGIIGLTKSAAKELAPRGITVNAVAPGFIDTDMTGDLSEDTVELYKGIIPLKRFGSVEDVASAVAFLASDQASYITGQVLNVCGGMHM